MADNMVDSEEQWRSRWLGWRDTWHNRLEAAGLGEIAGAMGAALRPLAPAAAQLLWVMQPAFGLFGQPQAVDALAALLDGPGADRDSPHGPFAK